MRAKEPNLPHCRRLICQSIQMYKCNTVIIIIIFGSICTEFLRLFTTRIVRVIRRNETTEKEVNYQQTKDLWALDVEKSSCIGHDNNSHLSWVFTYPHVAMLRAALTSASATFPQCAQRKCLPCLMPIWPHLWQVCEVYAGRMAVI